MKARLEHITWLALSGAQASFACGTDTARRYARGFSPILGFSDVAQADFAALLPYCASGEQFYCDGWSGPVPAAWQLDAESSMFKMLWEGPLPDAPDAPLALLPLGPQHARQALALAELTRPGPFGLRTIELGQYLGCFDGERLIAMAGERMFSHPLREISGVCTDPAYQGRGLARALMLALIRQQMLRAETPFLHVMRENVSAHQLYTRMGFRSVAESVVRVLSLR
ncbi:MAG: GNAT family N-acetyltransferase [Pseudomonadota bacterium]